MPSPSSTAHASPAARLPWLLLLTMLLSCYTPAHSRCHDQPSDERCADAAMDAGDQDSGSDAGDATALESGAKARCLLT